MLQLSQISLTWEMDVFFLEKILHSSHCEFWGATYMRVKGWGEQGGGKIHMDKVIKLLLWQILLEEVVEDYQMDEDLSKNGHNVVPRMVPKSSFRPCIKRSLISTGTEKLHLWIASASGAECLNAQRWSQSLTLCSYNSNPGTRWSFSANYFAHGYFHRDESFLARLILSYPPTYPLCQ